MDQQGSKSQKCEIISREIENHFRSQIPDVVQIITNSCSNKNCFDHIDTAIIPSRDEVIEILHLLRKIIYPGYFEKNILDRNNLDYHIGNAVTDIFEKLSRQITNSIVHECQRYSKDCKECFIKGQEETIIFLKKIPEIRKILAFDIIAAYNGDPAAQSYDEIIFSYPGLFAITIYRIAHELYQQDITLLPRMMTEYAHSMVGIDIHPASKIGKGFFIDHGTGVVIGETCSIGDNVRLYQGVTLGALSFQKDEDGALVKGQKRHPTIENDVIIYSGATILGGNTVIGEKSVIGGNVWITESVPVGTKVMIEKPNLIYKNCNNK